METVLAFICRAILALEAPWSIACAALVYLSVVGLTGNHAVTGLLLAAVPFVARWAYRGYISQRTPFDLPLALVVLAGLIGVYAASDRSLAWSVLATLLAALLFYYSFVNYAYPGLLMKVGLPVAAVAGIVATGYVWLQRETVLPFYSTLQEWLDITPAALPEDWANAPLHASACGVTVAAEVITVIAAGVALFYGPKWVRLGAGLLTAGLLAVLVISGCHATWVVLSCAMMLLWACRSKWLLLTTPVWLWFIYSSWTSWRGWTLEYALERVMANLDFKMSTRWEGIAGMLWDHPVTGVGLGMYPEVSVDYGVRGQHAHNSYLQFYSDFGLLGALALLVAGVIFLKVVWDIARSPRRHPWRGVAVGAAVAVVAAAAYSMVESAPATILVWLEDGYFYAISPLFVVIIAVLAVGHRAVTGGRGPGDGEPDGPVNGNRRNGV